MLALSQISVVGKSKVSRIVNFINLLGLKSSFSEVLEDGVLRYYVVYVDELEFEVFSEESLNELLEIAKVASTNKAIMGDLC